MVNSINKGTPKVGDNLELEGTNLDGCDEVLFMSAATKENIITAPAVVTDTKINVLVPDLYSGGYYVYLRKPDVGFSSINSTIVMFPSLDGFSPSEGASTGGIFTITGQGIPYNAVIKKGNVEQEFISQTVNSITFRAVDLG